MIELRQFARSGTIAIPDWATALRARPFVASSQNASPAPAENSFSVFASGFVMRVPLTDTTIYLDYLARRFTEAGGELHRNVRIEKLDEIDSKFDLIINCAGFGAKQLVHDVDLEPHRGQVAIVRKIDISCAIVCDDAPLMYAIPRANDCLFGGTNDLSEDRHVDRATTSRIVAECSHSLNIDPPEILADRVGIRPFRKSGVRVEREKLPDDRTVIHNYGHGGSGFTLSWGCAMEVLQLAAPLLNPGKS